MNIMDATKIIRSREDRRWLRYRGEDYLNEVDAKEIIEAARLLADELDRYQQVQGSL